MHGDSVFVFKNIFRLPVFFFVYIIILFFFFLLGKYYGQATFYKRAYLTTLKFACYRVPNYTWVERSNVEIMPCLGAQGAMPDRTHDLFISRQVLKSLDYSTTAPLPCYFSLVLSCLIIMNHSYQRLLFGHLRSCHSRIILLAQYMDGSNIIIHIINHYLSLLTHLSLEKWFWAINTS